MINVLKQTKNIITILLFFVIGWFLFTYRILETPPGINGDEAVIGYNAALVAKNGLDSNGTFLPLFASAVGSNDWKQPVTFYSTVLTFKIFGASYFNLRAVSVFFVLVSGVVIFFLALELLGYKGAIASLFIYTTIPIVMIQSHLALENIAPVPFIAFWLWTVMKHLKSPNHKYLILGSLSLSLSLFSYLGMKLIIPVLVSLNIAFLFYPFKKGFKNTVPRVLILLLIVGIFSLVFLAVKEKYPGSFFGQFRPYQIFSYQQFFLPYLSSFDPSFLFIKGDVVSYHSTGRQGMFLLATLPLFIFGSVKIIQNRRNEQIFILLCFFLTPFLFGLASDIYRASRLLILVPFYTLISATGFIYLYRFSRPLILIIIILVLLNYSDFLNDYWFEYPKRVQAGFSKPFHLVFDRAAEFSKEYNLTPLIEKDFKAQNKLAVDFFEEIYFKGNLEKWQMSETLPKSSVAIVNFSKEMESVDYEKIPETNFAIVYNR